MSVLRTLTLASALLLAVPAAAQANRIEFDDLGTTGCGPVLTGTFTPISQGSGLRLNLTISNTTASRPDVLLLIGPLPQVPGLNIDPLFGQNFGCELNLVPVFTQTHRGSNNSYTWSRSVGGWVGTGYAQMAEVLTTNGLQVRTTNVLEVTRPLT